MQHTQLSASRPIASRLSVDLAPSLPPLQLREVLEKFLDDDSDMKDLNLTAKVRQTTCSRCF